MIITVFRKMFVCFEIEWHSAEEVVIYARFRRDDSTNIELAVMFNRGTSIIRRHVNPGRA